VIRHLIALSTAAALTAAAAGCSKPAAAPAPAPAAGAHPDFSGSWVRPLGATGLGGLPALGDIPLTPWAAAKLKAERPAAGDNQDFANTTDPSLKYADPNGYPRISLHPMRFKLIQTNDYVYQLWEYNQNWRQIALNTAQESDPALTWYGNAVGKWEGDTLVVDSIGYKDSTWLDARGLPHTKDLHLVERIHRVGENLAFDITFEDPGAFTKPWAAHVIFKPSPDGSMTENIYTISDELRFRERFLRQKAAIPIRR
jgi:hypothetical protein